MNEQLWRFRGVGISMTAVAVVMVLTAFGCGEKSPIKIGYAGGLTGQLSDLGIAGRDGALLAVDEINASGGVEGRPLRLIVKDDRSDPQTATKVDQELIDEKVVAIVGHMTSSMSVAALPVINKAHMVMVSPTTSSSDLSDVDDYFLRIYPTTRIAADRLAVHVRQRLGLASMVVIYDTANRSYTESYLRHFRNKFAAGGGAVIFTSAFSSSNKPGYLELARQAIGKRPDGILILAGAVDTAMLCQQIRKVGSKLPIVASEWSGTSELLKLGSSSLEGLSFYQYFDDGSTAEPYMRFKKAYLQRFGADPTSAAAYAYETVRLVTDGLRQMRAKRQDLRGAIIGIGTFAGLQGPVSINRFGDAERTPCLMTVCNSRFVRVE